MSAILTAQITIKNLEKFMEYGAKAMPTVAAHGGEPLYRGQVKKALRGEATHTFVAAFRFPDVASADAWFTSADYEALHDLRDEGADVTFVVSEEF